MCIRHFCGQISFFPPHFIYFELSNLLIQNIWNIGPLVNNIFKYLKSTLHMTNFGHFANFDGNKLSDCNFVDANIFSYYYFIYIFYPVFMSCVVAWWAIFVVGLRFMGWLITTSNSF
jgi:hypothetical protein